MNQKRHHRRAAFAGPKALAVLSCALALLTAQPWSARAEQRSQTAAIRSVGGATKVDGQTANSETTATTTPQKNVIAAIRRESVGGESHARLQARWAAIHNWIATKFFVSHSAAGVKQLDVHTPEQIKFEWTPDLVDEKDVEEFSSHYDSELQWAIEHLLLAPPAC